MKQMTSLHMEINVYLRASRSDKRDRLFADRSAAAVKFNARPTFAVGPH